MAGMMPGAPPTPEEETMALEGVAPGDWAGRMRFAGRPQGVGAVPPPPAPGMMGGAPMGGGDPSMVGAMGQGAGEDEAGFLSALIGMLMKNRPRGGGAPEGR